MEVAVLASRAPRAATHHADDGVADAVLSALGGLALTVSLEGDVVSARGHAPGLEVGNPVGRIVAINSDAGVMYLSLNFWLRLARSAQCASARRFPKSCSSGSTSNGRRSTG